MSIVIAIAGCVATPQDTGTSAASIVGGQPTTTDPAIVLLFNASGTLLTDGCSGSLVAPRIVLAAAHCGDVAEVMFVDSYDSMTTATTGALGAIAVTKQYTDPQFQMTGLLGGHDVTFLALAHPAPARPLPYNRAALTAALVGMPMRIVGFGATSPSSTSTTRLKRTVTTKMSDFDANQITSATPNQGPCEGDSGGATMMTLAGVETLIGVTNYSDSQCAFQYGANRVDIRATELTAFIVTNDDTIAGCGFDGTCQTGCVQPDPDCPCASDGLCTTACATPDADPDCPKGCLANGVCIAAGCPTPDPDCPIPVVSCAQLSDCKHDEVCDFEGNYCTTFCNDPSLRSCPAGRTCGASSGLCELPPSLPPPHAMHHGCRVGGDATDASVPLLGAVLLALARRRRRATLKR